jgi:hypothetical protein
MIFVLRYWDYSLQQNAIRVRLVWIRQGFPLIEAAAGDDCWGGLRQPPKGSPLKGLAEA